jgi:hypothetical protein
MTNRVADGSHSGSNALTDVLAIPDLCQQVYDKLEGRSRVALSHTSRSIRCQVGKPTS